MTESKSIRAIARTTSDRAIHTPYDDEHKHAAPEWIRIGFLQSRGKHMEGGNASKAGKRRALAYVAGPMSGRPALNRPAFEKARREIEANPRVKAVIPFDLYTPKGPALECPALAWTEAMVRCLPKVKVSSVVYFLAGWQQSSGASAEHRKAMEWHKKIVYEKEDEAWASA